MQPEYRVEAAARPPLSLARFAKFIQFMATGLPAFLMAVGLNFALVDRLGVNRALAYAGVLVAQSFVNFVLLRLFVFKKSPTSSTTAAQDFATLFAGVAVVRALDWGLYSFLVHAFEWPFLVVQLGNVALFSVVRFLYAEWALR